MVSLVVVLQQLLLRSGKDDDDGVVDEMDKDDDVLSIILTWSLFLCQCMYIRWSLFYRFVFYERTENTKERETKKME